MHTGTCRPGDGSSAGPFRVRAGEVCSPGDACGGGTRCRPFEFGVCVPRLAEGAPCSGENAIECLLGTFCHPERLRCEPFHHAWRGQFCQAYSDCYSGACSDKEGICVAKSGCASTAP